MKPIDILRRRRRRARVASSEIRVTWNPDQAWTSGALAARIAEADRKLGRCETAITVRAPDLGEWPDTEVPSSSEVPSICGHLPSEHGQQVDRVPGGTGGQFVTYTPGTVHFNECERCGCRAYLPRVHRGASAAT